MEGHDPNDLLRQAGELATAGRDGEALAVYQRLVEAAGDNAYMAAEAYYGMGGRLVSLDRADEAVTAYDHALGSGADEDVHLLSRALYGRAFALEKAGRLDDAIAATALVVRRVGRSEDERVRRIVVWALYLEGRTLEALGRLTEAERAYGRIAGEFKDVDDEDVPWAMNRRGFCLARTDRIDEAIASYDAALVRCGEDPGLARLVSRTLAAKATLLALRERNDEAIVVADAAAERLGNATRLGDLQTVAEALLGEGLALVQESRHEEAIALFDAIAARFEAASDESLRGMAAIALMNKTESLAALGDMDGALSVHEQMVRDFGDAAVTGLDRAAANCGAALDPALRKQLAGILFKKGTVLAELERLDEATAVFGDLIDRFEADDDDHIQLVVAAARSNLEGLGEDE